ncbi:MAG: hypothetical protein J6R06_00190 [Bacteroidales bacterium]|nr:hypothetical protein [Bacteroidales bacterium]
MQHRNLITQTLCYKQQNCFCNIPIFPETSSCGYINVTLASIMQRLMRSMIYYAQLLLVGCMTVMKSLMLYIDIAYVMTRKNCMLHISWPT